MNITRDGFELSLFGETSGEHLIVIPRQGEEYNFELLHDDLVEIKEKYVNHLDDAVPNPDTLSNHHFEDADVIRIAAAGDLPWQVLVDVLDASRVYTDTEGTVRPLFPAPVMGQIQ